jgi:outer membrane protein OmpU|tara:strand:- start:1471 stop:2511 length:1041 start_codon:yes stop_codon:yes gene_type:complete
MNNFKKVGFSALAGSLAMISAQAVEVSWSGDSTIAWTSGNTNETGAKAAEAGSIAADTGLSVSASGELDNGWTVSTAMDTGTNNTVSSAQLTIGLGDMGTIQFNQMAGSLVNGIDDVLPTAYEETNDGSTHTVLGHSVGSAATSGSISYKTPALELSGMSVQAMVDYDPAADVAGGGAGGMTTVTGDAGSAIAYGLTVDSGMGLKVYGAYETVTSKTQNTVATDGSGVVPEDGTAVGVQAVYAYGPVSVGYGEWYTNEKDGGRDYDTAAYSVAFNVNDSLSISYGSMDDTQNSILGVKTTTEITSYNLAYSMGSMAVKVKHTDTDKPNFVASTTAERTEIAVSFSF